MWAYGAASFVGWEVHVFSFEMNNESGVPLWAQLKSWIVHLINSGYYKPGDQLPTVHAAALELSINYNTVNKVYVSLMRDGYITSIRGRGAFVNDLEGGEASELDREVEAILEGCLNACGELGVEPRDVERALQRLVRKKEKLRESAC